MCYCQSFKLRHRSSNGWANIQDRIGHGTVCWCVWRIYWTDLLVPTDFYSKLYSTATIQDILVHCSSQTEWEREAVAVAYILHSQLSASVRQAWIPDPLQWRLFKNGTVGLATAADDGTIFIMAQFPGYANRSTYAIKFELLPWQSCWDELMTIHCLLIVRDNVTVEHTLPVVRYNKPLSKYSWC